MLIAPLALLLLLLLVLVLFVLPIWLLVSGILRVADGRRGGHVEFTDGTASVFRGSKLYKTIDLKPPETTDPYDPPRAPASLSAEDVFRELTR